jgi:hypothetical protein
MIWKTEKLGFDSRQLLQSFQCSTATAPTLGPIQLYIQWISKIILRRLSFSILLPKLRMHDIIDPVAYKASMRNAELSTAINFPFHSLGIAQTTNKYGLQMNTRKEAENIKLLIMLSHPVPCYLIPLRPKCLPQHVVLKHHQPA